MRASAVLLLVAFTTPALAQSYYERTPGELPAPLDRGAPLVLVCEKAGVVHWGKDGWKDIQDTALEGPGVDGRYRARIGPLPAAKELDFAIKFADGSWDSNGGRDYRIALADGVPVHRRPITIGSGSTIGKAGGVEYREDLNDWDLEDCRGLDAADDARALGDGEDAGRDLIAFYSRRENGNLYLRADLLDLALGAESRGVLVLGFLVSWGGQKSTEWLPDFAQTKTKHPWNAALVVRGPQSVKLYDASWSTVLDEKSPRWKGASYRSDLDAVELGIAEEALERAGWDGKAPLHFQVYTMKDQDGRVADAFAEKSLDDGTLDEQTAETARGGTAKLATILHGNQAVQSLGAVRELVRSQNVLTPNKNPTGYHRALDVHEVFRAPVNFHISATLAATLEWAEPSFNERIRGFLGDRPWRGRGAFLGGVLSEHILPYFEGANGPNVEGTRLDDRVLRSLYGVAKPRVFWTPERVIRGTTFADIKAAGYDFTVIDEVTHVRDWFGDDATTGHKINKISGVNCFLINDEADQWKFANSDGGLWLATRRGLVARALDKDQEQITVVFDDWEASSGRSFTSFGVGNDNPDNYDKNVRWLAAHPWVQVVTLEEVASWGWGVKDRGDRPDLGLDTYDWLRHACQKSYDQWFHGSSLEEAFSAWHPTILGGAKTPKAIGQLGRPGTILNDAWQDVARLGSSELKNLAVAVYGCATFETAWHDQTENDYLTKTSSGDYAKPDTTWQPTSGWAKAINARTGDASLVAAAGRWAASPPQTVKTWSEDLDQDGEPEHVLANDRVFCIFKKAGGRLLLAAARDPSSGDADLVVGSLLQGPGNNEERDRVEESASDLKRPPALIDWWATNGGARYVNAAYSMQQIPNGLKLTSDDGKIVKSITLSGSKLSVRYESQVGDLYVRSALAPAPFQLFAREGQLSEQRPSSNTLVVQHKNGSRTVKGSITTGNNSSINDGAHYGPDGPRGVAFTRQVEVKGTGTFELTMDMSLAK
ncbi:MAG: hypothetical protein ACAI25_19620 [Planctomycetota bacterium]